jgi:hypothetical protein
MSKNRKEFQFIIGSLFLEKRGCLKRDSLIDFKKFLLTRIF